MISLGACTRELPAAGLLAGGPACGAVAIANAVDAEPGVAAAAELPAGADCGVPKPKAGAGEGGAAACGCEVAAGVLEKLKPAPAASSDHKVVVQKRALLFQPREGQ